jgi:FixJ family two-component response regulator
MGTAEPQTVIVVHEHADVRVALENLLQCGGFRVRTHESLHAFLNTLPEPATPCLVVGVPVHRSDTPVFLDALGRLCEDAPVVLLATNGSGAPGLRAAMERSFTVLDFAGDPGQLLLAIRRAFADHHAGRVQN